MNEPKLPEQLRNQAPGIIVIHYADGDMRQRVFDHAFIERGITLEPCDYPHCETPCTRPCDNKEVKDGIVTQEDVKTMMIPSIQKTVEAMRADPGEPEHAGYELYWLGNLIWEEKAPQYIVVPVVEEGNPTATQPTHTDLMVPPEGLHEYLNREAEEAQDDSTD